MEISKICVNLEKQVVSNLQEWMPWFTCSILSYIQNELVHRNSSIFTINHLIHYLS